MCELQDDKNKEFQPRKQQKRLNGIIKKKYSKEAEIEEIGNKQQV